MERLIFFLAAIVLTGISVYVIPLGFTRKEKNVIALSSALIGTLGLISISVVHLWQVLLLMLLLAVCSGYIIVNRLTVVNTSIPLIERLHEHNNPSLSEGRSPKSQLEKEVDLESFDIQPKLNTLEFREEEPRILFDDDISFLDDRNSIDIPAVEWNQSSHILANPEANDENWVIETDQEKVYAGTHT